MKIDRQQHGAVTVLEPRGAIIQGDAEIFASRLNDTVRESMGRLVIDVTHVPYVDSLGLETLSAAAQDLQQTGQSMRIAGANETLRAVLEITELEFMFDHYHDVNSAVRSFL